MRIIEKTEMGMLKAGINNASFGWRSKSAAMIAIVFIAPIPAPSIQI